MHPGARKTRAWLCLVAIALGASAACGGAPTGEPETPQLPGPIDVSGTYLHVVTKLEFPETIGPFVRVGITRYDPGAVNVSGHYLLASQRAIATVYHYPATLDGSIPPREAVMKHFEDVKGDVVRGTPDFYLVEESPYRVTINGFSILGFKAVYQAPRTRGYDEPVDSTAYLFSIGPWFLKFRFTYPREFTAQVEPLERSFISSIRWEIPRS